MPRYQFEVGVGLLIISAAGTLLAFKGFRKRQLHLVDDNELNEDYDGSANINILNSVQPKDFIEGYPKDESGFWRNMRNRKIVMALTFALTLVPQAVITGISSSHQSLQYFVYSTFTLWMLIYTMWAINRRHDAHSNFIICISIIMTIAVLGVGFATIIPSEQSSKQLVLHIQQLDLVVWYLQLGLYFFCCVVAATTPRGPTAHYLIHDIYNSSSCHVEAKIIINTAQSLACSMFSFAFFSFTTEIFMLGRSASVLELIHLPILSVQFRSAFNFSKIKQATRNIRSNSGFELGYILMRLNWSALWRLQLMAGLTAFMCYAPIFAIQKFLEHLEMDPDRQSLSWGWVYVTAIFFSNSVLVFLNSQLWSLSSNTLRTGLRLQLNTILFAKTLARKDVASSISSGDRGEDPNDLSSKAQVMTLMTTDVNRVSDLSRHIFTATDSIIGISIGTFMLYRILGISCFVGLVAVFACVPLNQLAGKALVAMQENIMKARDERLSLTNEALGAIRMLKFMGWERNFEARINRVRSRELKYQKKSFRIETLWNSMGSSIPLLFAVTCFWHFTVIQRKELTPAMAFTAVIFGETQFGITQIPELFVDGLQALVSLRRIEKYLNVPEIVAFTKLQECEAPVIRSATISWPKNVEHATGLHAMGSTPRPRSFSLENISLEFPPGEVSLVCGKTGSGKSLLLLGFLGEADILSGQVLCPRSPLDHIASCTNIDPSTPWIVKGTSAYVPQIPWLRNQSIRSNILFNLPYDSERYQKTLEACALIRDLEIFEDGDASEIGEQGINLSGGQKARISLARAVYSRASLLLLDDVLSSVDAHTARHLYHQCIKGELLTGRTIILISHNVQLCGPGAGYIVALDHGRVSFSGSWTDFEGSPIMHSIIYNKSISETKFKDGNRQSIIDSYSETEDDALEEDSLEPGPEILTFAPTKPTSRRFIEEEKRAIGRISRTIWTLYLRACGNRWYWMLFYAILALAATAPILANGWLKIWSSSTSTSSRAVYYLSVYAAVSFLSVVCTPIIRWLILFSGSIHASQVLYQKLLQAVLFTNIRFHDTISRGRLLNRFGKDFEAIDVTLPNELGRAMMITLALITTFGTITFVGGWIFFILTIIVGSNLTPDNLKVYGQIARDLRRLSSTTSSQLFSIYGEAISGLAVIRAFGASTQIMRDMLSYSDMNMNPYYWNISLNRWLSVRFQLACGGLMAFIALLALLSPTIDASLAGLALSFAWTLSLDLLWVIRRLVDVEQTMVALERVKEYSDLVPEGAEFIEPRPPAAWPSEGSIKCEDLVIRYAPDLPNVLHNINFEIRPGEKVGFLGRTGSGKSTLSLSLLRFVEPTAGRIFIDGIDISEIGLTDLRRRLTIIPQEPIILSGTIRSTIDVFAEYDDAQIFDALRRVQLIPGEGALLPELIHVEDESRVNLNTNIFSNLDSPVSELGENFSTGEKQLLCMARALLRRSKILLMDEVRLPHIDYATDERISKTIREEFIDSTVLTIAHRLRTVVDYDRIMVLEEGRIVEFDRPELLLANKSSKFYSLCEATGTEEFAVLKAMLMAKMH
ncbi:multidrug resistance-associated ABC transporter [Crucibulum laeve]|uniref:Multidrug resistance-associated ABC transporter n=1 Tax=Crucibulum laeve TaxID=68775 RepID=A0A5C3LHT4_9AGAR|nr:multidrug resistance-associated ABC transporter [Crucibulum laeve]